MTDIDKGLRRYPMVRKTCQKFRLSACAFCCDLGARRSSREHLNGVFPLFHRYIRLYDHW